MSMFRRPTDESSDSDSSTEELDEEDGIVKNSQNLSSAGDDELIGPDLTATETLSSGESISLESENDASAVQNVEHHRDMILASLLEEFYRTRAVELFNASNVGGTYHRQSPEIQPLAQSLFAQASQDLASAGILPAHVANSNFQSARKQYLVGFDNLGLQNLKDRDLLPEAIKQRISQDDGNLAVIKALKSQVLTQPGVLDVPLRELSLHSGTMSLMPHPANDLQLSTTYQRRSHYQSSFHETCLLGKGGFGRVYQTYNLFDKREYAVKKIPLSPKLSQRYRDHGHGELRQVLREVQALAQLDHCNVVRYHATWIEEPSSFETKDTAQSRPTRSFPKHKLLDNKPAAQYGPHLARKDIVKNEFIDDGGGIMFADSHPSNAVSMDLGWSDHPDLHPLDSSSMPDSDIFTDGVSRRASQEVVADNSQCYVLHVQMSMYPMTLTHYMRPEPSINARGSTLSSRRHCFHLVPSLKILLGILSGLQYVHARGLIHRDIKPSNIFLSSYEQKLRGRQTEGFLDVGSCLTCDVQKPFFVNPRIGDFGLVADVALGDDSPHSSPSNSASKTVGTQFYHPPKDSNSKNKSVRVVDEKLDVFALGVILAELLCPCGTTMERLDLLRALQNGKVPEGVLSSVKVHPEGEHVTERVRELIEGMIESDHIARWSCPQVREFIQMVLTECDTQPLAGV